MSEQALVGMTEDELMEWATHHSDPSGMMSSVALAVRTLFGKLYSLERQVRLLREKPQVLDRAPEQAVFECTEELLKESKFTAVSDEDKLPVIKDDGLIYDPVLADYFGKWVWDNLKEASEESIRLKKLMAEAKMVPWRHGVALVNNELVENKLDLSKELWTENPDAIKYWVKQPDAHEAKPAFDGSTGTPVDGKAGYIGPQPPGAGQ